MTLGVFVGFHALEGCEGVVEYTCCGVEGEVLVGGYSWGEPAGGGSPFDAEHVVCECAAEDQVLRGQDGFRGSGFHGGEEGRIDIRELGEGCFLGLDAVMSWFGDWLLWETVALSKC